MKHTIVLTAFLAGLPALAWAQTQAPPPGSYPDPQCTKPQVPVNPDIKYSKGPNEFDSGAVGSYNSRVKAFNRDSAAYNACLHAYIDKASLEVKSIQDKANADLKQITERANVSMKVIQDKIKQAVADGNDVSAALDRDTAKLRK